MELTKKTERWFSIDFTLEKNIIEFMCDILWPNIQDFKKRKLIKTSFFIREWENEQIIKVIVNPSHSLIDIDDLVNEITNNSIFQSYVSINPCSVNFLELNMNNYKLQYGGDIGFNLMAELFDNSSTSTYMILNYKNKEWSYSLAMSYVIQKHLIFLKNSFMDLNETISFLNFQLDNSIYLSFKESNPLDHSNQKSYMLNHFELSYYKQEQLIEKLINRFYIITSTYDDKWMIKWENNIRNKLSKFLDFQKDNLINIPTEYKKSQTPLISSDKLVKWMIFSDLIHLENNRLGINYRDEPFVCYLILKGIMNYKNKLV